MPQERKPFCFHAKPSTTSIPIGRRGRVKRAIFLSLLRVLASLCSRARRLLSSLIDSILRHRNAKLTSAMDMQMLLELLLAPHFQDR